MLAWLVSTLLAAPTAAKRFVPAAPAPASLDLGVGVYLERCSTCHGAMGPSAKDLVDHGVSRQRAERAWATTSRPGPMPERWSPAHYDPLLVRLFAPRHEARGVPIRAWKHHGAAHIERALEEGHDLPAGMSWPQGEERSALNAAMRWAHSQSLAARSNVRIASAAILALALVLLAAARLTPSALLRASLPTPSWTGILLGSLLVSLLHVRLRPAPFDVLALVVVVWACLSGAVPRRALLGLGLWLAWVAGSAVDLVAAVPRTVDPMFWSYLAAEVEIPLLALALVSLSRRHRIQPGRFRAALAAGVALETLMLAGLLVSGNEDALFDVRPNLGGWPRVVGAFRDPNIFGGTHAALCAVFVDALRRRSLADAQDVPQVAAIPRGLDLAGAVMSAIWAFASGSRAAAAGLLAMAALNTVIVWRSPVLSRRQQVAGALLGGVVLLGFVVWLARAELSEVFRRGDFTRASLLTRAYQTITPSSALFGNGLMASERAAGWVAPHATLVRIFGEQGLLRWLLLGWILAVAAGGRLRPLRLMAVGAGLLAPLLLVDVAHWRVLALLPCLAMTELDGPSAARVVQVRGARALLGGGRRLVLAAVAGLFAALAVLAVDGLQEPPRTEILAMRCGVPGLGVNPMPRIVPDYRDGVRCGEVFEDALRRTDPPIGFLRADASGKVRVGGWMFRFELPMPDAPDAADAAHRLACVMNRWRDPGPCDRPTTDERALEAAWTSLRHGKICAWSVRALAPNTLPRRRAAGLVGLFVFGLALSAGHLPRRTHRFDHASP